MFAGGLSERHETLQGHIVAKMLLSLVVTGVESAGTRIESEAGSEILISSGKSSAVLIDPTAGSAGDEPEGQFLSDDKEGVTVGKTGGLVVAGSGCLSDPAAAL